jgi:hypothetical protein
MASMSWVYAASLMAALCEDGSIPRIVTNEIAAEAAAVLRDAGVELEFVIRSGDACREENAGAADIVVRIEHVTIEAHASESKQPVASIQFLGGRPQRTIRLSLSAARDLMNRDPAARARLALVTQRVADRWAGRMLGRALAHEIGHYVLRSPRHSRTGLMRASQSVEAFIRPDRSAFRLTAADRLSFLSAVASNAEPVAASAR